MKKKVLYVCEDLAKNIPTCENLSEYKEFWSPSPAYEMDSDLLKEIRNGIFSGISRFIRQSSDEKVTETIKKLHPGTRKYLSIYENFPSKFGHL